MNLISIKRETMRRAHRTHVLRNRPRRLSAEVRGDAVHEISFIVPGEGGRDYIMRFLPHELDSMHEELARIRRKT